ncbi:hypothetical protein VNO78_25639 [Psophocarpus tetragonolobus]|uniref:Transmembrane protein n=1 Tax=Psophocarpus tetragonolobus TaxID=3891 RepID=A0AAN9S7A3_PSOTE
MATELSPSNNPHDSDELHFLSDPKFERHGEILLLVFVLLFSVFLLVVAVLMYVKRVRAQIKQNEGSKLEA